MPLLRIRKPSFGTGAGGVAATVLIWVLALTVERWLGMPKIEMGGTFRWVVLFLFAADFSATVFWSLWAKGPSGEGMEMKIEGPYRLVRFPLYSAIIFSGTGMVAFWYRSWIVIFSVIVINLFWTWRVRKEENRMLARFGEEYREYMRSTGQLFPRLRPFQSGKEES